MSKEKKTTKEAEGEKTPEELQAEKLEKTREAGKITQDVFPKAEKLVKVGAKVIDICENIEQMIKEKGGDFGFPCNVSINSIAAHYSSPPNDETIIKENDVVKVDFGVHKDGYISDFAFTVCFNPELNSLVEAAEEALRAVIENVKPGAKTHELGALAEQAIKKYGFRPVIDLSGHLLEQWELHGKKVIPEISLPTGEEIKEGEIYAMETFATTGSGRVHDLPYCYIYNLLPTRIYPRSKPARKIIRIIRDKYKTLPFAKRWLPKEVGMGYLIGLRELVRSKILHEYKPLADIKGSYIAQREYTFIVTSDGCEIINGKFP
ncbi:MAG: type II methionyl aminopeptidase [Candidatus Helarchaeota archaeon]|nr:type II methionyl aminopeptidase [Candidatus Helarchaeota archaeon]